MPGPTRIEGFAIVSEDGMLADAARHIPPALVVEADQKFFHGSLEHAAVVVHGRHSHEGGPRADTRHRLVVTHRVPSLAPHPTLPKTLLWNPHGASLEEAWAQTRRARRHAGGDRRPATSTRSSSTAAMTRFICRGSRASACPAAFRFSQGSDPTGRRRTFWLSTASSRGQSACSMRRRVRRW